MKTESKYTSAVAFHAMADRPATAAAAPCKSTAGSCKSKDKMQKVGKDGKAQMLFGFAAYCRLDRPHIASTLPSRPTLLTHVAFN